MNDKERKSCINTIELLRRLAFNVHGVMDVIDAQNCDKIIEMLNKPERKKGRWIHKKNVYGVVYCSECDYELHTNDTNFCPDCGADMR